MAVTLSQAERAFLENPFVGVVTTIAREGRRASSPRRTNHTVSDTVLSVPFTVFGDLHVFPVPFAVLRDHEPGVKVCAWRSPAAQTRPVNSKLMYAACGFAAAVGPYSFRWQSSFVASREVTATPLGER
jgi:hypothetical protein